MTTEAPILSETNLWFDLMDNSELAESRRARTYKSGEEPCTFCGRKTNPKTAWWVHGAVTGQLIRADQDDHADSQGWWTVGSECAKKVPAAYKNRPQI